MYVYSIDNQVYNEIFLCHHSARKKVKEKRSALNFAEIRLQNKASWKQRSERRMLVSWYFWYWCTEWEAAGDTGRAAERKTFKDTESGNLIYNTDTDFYKGEINWCGEKCPINIAYRDEKFLKTYLKAVYYLAENQQNIKDEIYRQISDINPADYSSGCSYANQRQFREVIWNQDTRPVNRKWFLSDTDGDFRGWETDLMPAFMSEWEDQRLPVIRLI